MFTFSFQHFNLCCNLFYGLLVGLDVVCESKLLVKTVSIKSKRSICLILQILLNTMPEISLRNIPTKFRCKILKIPLIQCQRYVCAHKNRVSMQKNLMIYLVANTHFSQFNLTEIPFANSFTCLIVQSQFDRMEVLFV